MVIFKNFIFITRFAIVHSLAALAACSFIWFAAHEWQASALTSLDQLQSQVYSALEQPRAAAPTPTAEPATTGPDPSGWPSRHSADALVEQASQQAQRKGLAVRAVSVAHNAATPSAWGRVMLEVSTTGPYAAQKAWQASLQQVHPALAVQSVRWQAASAPVAGLDAQWTWVLHVRD